MMSMSSPGNLKGRRVHALMFSLGALSVVLFYAVVSSFGAMGGSYSNKVAIIILGGGLNKEGKIYDHVELRVQHAYKLYTKLKERNSKLDVKLIALSGGTPHKPPPLDSAGFPITEAQGSAQRLLEMQVSPTDILEEGFSLDTLGNAYFLRNTHIDPGRFSKMMVVTNDWHMPRTIAYFKKVFDLPMRHSWFSHTHGDLEIEYQSVGAGLSSPLLESRVSREQESLRFFLEHTKHQFSTMEELHAFLYTKHKAYSSSRLLQGHVKIDGSVSDTY